MRGSLGTYTQRENGLAGAYVRERIRPLSLSLSSSVSSLLLSPSLLSSSLAPSPSSFAPLQFAFIDRPLRGPPLFLARSYRLKFTPSRAFILLLPLRSSHVPAPLARTLAYTPARRVPARSYRGRGRCSGECFNCCSPSLGKFHSCVLDATGTYSERRGLVFYFVTNLLNLLPIKKNLFSARALLFPDLTMAGKLNERP